MGDRHNLCVLFGFENRHTLCVTTGNANIINRATNESAAIGHQHNLISFLNRESGQ